jgi:hypothetical protein
MSVNNVSSSSSSGIGFSGLLTVLFVALKLTGYIDWSWWWVTSPLWIGLAVVILVVLIAVSIGLWLGK